MTLGIAFLLSFIVLVMPLTIHFQKDKEKCFLNELKLQAVFIEHILSTYVSMAESLGSRTVIRQKLFDYHQGKTSLEELSVFTAPKFADGASALKGLMGAARYLPDGTPVATWGDPSAQARLEETHPGLFLIKDNETLLAIVVAPITEKNIPIGYDVCVFNANILLESRSDYVKSLDIVNKDDTLGLQDSYYVPVFSNMYFLAGKPAKNIATESAIKGFLYAFIYTVIYSCMICGVSYFIVFKLVKSEKFWKDVLESLQDPLIVLDRDRRVQLLNPAAALLANVKPEEAQGRFCRDVFSPWHERSGACEQCAAQEVLETEAPCSRQLEIQLRDGSSRVFHVQVSPLKENGAGVRGVIESFRDITQEVQVRRELTEHHRELSLLFDHMQGGFALHEILTDDQGLPVDYRFLKVNRAFEELTGLKAEHIVGKTLREVLPAASSGCVERYGRTVLGGEPQEFEDFEPSFGRYFSVRTYQPEPKKLAVLFFDVSHRKQAEEALRQSEMFFRELFEKSAEPQLLINPTDGIILDVNEAAVRFYGWSREEIIGRLYQDLSTNSPDLIRERMTEALEKGGKIFLAKHRTASDDIKTVEVAFGPVTLNGDTRLLLFIHDVTEREKLQEQLRHAQKMQTVGQLAGGVAHEFNNLLQVINGFVEMMLSETPEDSPNHERLQKVMDSGLKGARLVQQLLAFSRKQVLRLEPVNLDDLLGEFRKLAQKLVGENIQVHHVPSQKAAWVLIDRQLMEQVFWNLVVNARDAMPDGGEILIETSRVELGEDYVKKHPLAGPGPYVMVTVTDTGCGMTEEVRQRVFEPFFTTKEVGKGTGLGLSVAFGIVQQHGGMINVYSEPGKGTTFRIYLKPYGEPQETSTKLKEVQEEAPFGTETILLAEDDSAVREYLANALREAGYKVLEAANGLDAVELFATTWESVDLLIFDMVMPGMGGEEAVHLIRKGGWNIPALLLSGYPGRANGLSTPFVSQVLFLEKPVSRVTLLQTVRKLLDGYTEGRQDSPAA